jgi:hypothetical protein
MPKHQAFRDDMLAVVKKHGEVLNKLEMLVLVSHLVGQLVALQDKELITPDHAMEVVRLNIEQGNQEAVAVLS